MFVLEFKNYELFFCFGAYIISSIASSPYQTGFDYGGPSSIFYLDLQESIFYGYISEGEG